jgi:hypothetical protein
MSNKVAHSQMPHNDRSLILILIGIPTLLFGIVAAIYGPIEFYPLYMFTEGGKFYYEGFGFGSFMFANIALQIVGYYIVALIFIPLGYGHLRQRRWVRNYALALLWFWLVVGAPIAVLFLLMIFSVKDYQPVLVGMILAFTGFSYPFLPIILIRFYNREDVLLTLEQHDQRKGWWDQTPIPILVLVLLFGLYVIFLHVPLLLRGIFPFFGNFLINLDGMFMIDAAILSLLFLLVGVIKRKRWAWWGSLIYFSLLLFNTVFTLTQVSVPKLLDALQLPATEMDILQGIPLSRYHLMVAFGLPLSLTIIAVIVSKRYFEKTAHG